jgi:hypothetical protein
MSALMGCQLPAVTQIERRDIIGHSSWHRDFCEAHATPVLKTGRAARNLVVPDSTNSPAPCLVVRQIPGSAISLRLGNSLNDPPSIF